MNNKNTGGTAFPSLNAECTGIDSDGHERFSVEPSGGMTLRDYFAAKAMQAAATNEKGADGFDFRQRAAWAYLQADAMLKARDA